MTTLAIITMILLKITTEQIISIAVLTVMIGGVAWILHVGKKETEMIFESDYYNLSEFIKDCHKTEENELKIRLRIIHLSKMPGVDKEKIKELRSECDKKFPKSTLGDIVAEHESY